MINISKAIQAIQKIDRNVLPHAEKQILINITILLSESNNTPTNELLGTNIGENKDYAKNLLSRIRKKGFLMFNGRGKKRKIEILWPKVFGNSQLPNDLFGNSQLPNRVQKSPTPLLNNVVVVLLEKYGFDFGPVIIEKLSRFPVDDQINAIESTKAHATKNPSRYIEKILDNDCRGIRLPDNEKPSQKNACITDEYNEYCGVKVKYWDKIYVIGDAGELVTDSGTHPFFKVKQYIENKVVEVIN